MRRLLVVLAFLISFGATGAEASSPLGQPVKSAPAKEPGNAAEIVEAQPRATTKHSQRKLDLALPERGLVIPATADRNPNPQGTTGRSPTSPGTDFDPWFPGRGLGVKVTTTW